MNRYSVLALVVLVGFVLPFGVSAQKYPKSNYKYKPKQRVYKSTTPSTSTHGNASGTKAIQGHTEDFEKLRNFSKSSNEYKLGGKVAHLYIDGWVCTGFLVGPDLLMTNEHCIIDEWFVQNCKVYMDYYSDNRKGSVSARVKQILKSSEALDYALLRLDRRLGDTHGWLQLDTKTPRKWSPVKIIQHPRGRSKEIVRRNTPITQVYSDMIHYQADTQGGSSGSPVFSLYSNSVIAIHRAGKAGYYNEGVLMKRIVPQIASLLQASKAPKPYDPPPKRVSPEARILKVWVDHNQFEDGVKGMRIHVKFEVDNLKGGKGSVIAYFYYKSGNPLKDSNEKYRTKSGKVSGSRNFQPRYVNSIYEDFKLFMPYRELHMGAGKSDLKFKVRILDKGTGQFLSSSSDWVHFTYTNPSARILKVWVDHNQFEDGVKGMRIHVKFEVDKLKGGKGSVNAYFHYKNGNPLKDFNEKYRTTNGKVSCGRHFQPGYVNTTYEDFKLFMPYRELHMKAGKYDLKFNVQIFDEGTGQSLSSSSDWVHFTYTK